MHLAFYKYQGTGNDFVMVDNRTLSWQPDSVEQVRKICDRRFGVGADGLILLEELEGYDFRMVYYNSDGRESTMCGNGGRCVSRFASDLGMKKEEYRFKAIDGDHLARVSEEEVSIRMIDVQDVRQLENAVFVDTGSPHHIVFSHDTAQMEIVPRARDIRYSDHYRQEGVNVNFVEVQENDHLFMRTYERGVEDETLSCGTGVTAAVLAAFKQEKVGAHKVYVHTRGGELSVSFKPAEVGFTDIWLTGPAEFVFEGSIEV